MNLDTWTRTFNEDDMREHLFLNTGKQALRDELRKPKWSGIKPDMSIEDHAFILYHIALNAIMRESINVPPDHWHPLKYEQYEAIANRALGQFLDELERGS